MKKAKETDVNVRVGARLRALRVNAGMTQTELANKFGCAFAQIQKYEYGQNRMAISTALRLARILECHIMELIGEDESADFGDRKIYPAKVMRLAHTLTKLSDSDFRLASQLCKRIAVDESERPRPKDPSPRRSRRT